MQSRQWPGTHARMPRMLHPACRRPSSQRRLSPLDEPRTRALSHHRRPIPTHATPPLLLRQSSTRGVHIRRPISAPRSKRPARGAPLEALPVGSPPLRATDHRTPDACNRDSPFDLCAAIGAPCHARQAMRRSHAPQHTSAARRQVRASLEPPPPLSRRPRASPPNPSGRRSLRLSPRHVTSRTPRAGGAQLRCVGRLTWAPAPPGWPSPCRAACSRARRRRRSRWSRRGHCAASSSPSSETAAARQGSW